MLVFTIFKGLAQIIKRAQSFQSFFPITDIAGWTQDQLSIGRHPHKDLKWTELWLGPIQTHVEAFLGFLVKTKMKAYKKLTVVMCCRIVARKFVAPSSGDFWRRPLPMYACGQDQEFGRKKSFSKRRPLRVCNIDEFSRATCFSLLGGLGGGGSPIDNLIPFICF